MALHTLADSNFLTKYWQLLLVSKWEEERTGKVEHFLHLQNKQIQASTFSNSSKIEISKRENIYVQYVSFMLMSTCVIDKAVKAVITDINIGLLNVLYMLRDSS